MPTSKEEGVLLLFQTFPAVPYIIVSLMGLFIVWQWKDRRAKKKQIHLIEQEAIQAKTAALSEKNTALENYVHTLAQGMSDAVVQMKSVTDELKGQIIQVKEDIKGEIRTEMQQCSLELRDEMKILHKRVTENSEDLHQLVGEHNHNMRTCPMYRDHKALQNKSLDPRVSGGRRYYDEHALFDTEDIPGGD